MINLVSTLYPTVTLSYPLIRRHGLSVLAFFVVSLLPFANASELQPSELATASATRSADEGVSPTELQTILAAAEVPTELWVAVGKNEFGIYEPDTAEIIAYVALYQSLKLAINHIDRILTSGSSGSSSTPLAGLSSGSASKAGSSIIGGSVGSSTSLGGSAGQSSTGTSSSAKTSGSPTDSSTDDSLTNSDFAQLLTENFTEFDEPAAAISQLDRASALPDNPELNPIFVAKVGDTGIDSSRISTNDAALASIAVPSPSSLWLLLFAPLFVPRQKQAAA